MENLSKGLVVDGCFCTEHIDTSGEILDVKGCDISDLQNGTGVLNWEHRGDNPTDILGKITYAKKIFSEKDCSNERELAYWRQVKVPMVYGQAELYDAEGHSGAMAAAALIRYYHNHHQPLLARFSIEGSTLERNGNTLVRSLARRVALTLKPCNRSAYSGVYSDDNPATLKQSEKASGDILSKGSFYETDLIVQDPVSKLSIALDRLKELSALTKAVDAPEAAPRLLEHYSPHADLKVIDPAFQGTGPRIGNPVSHEDKRRIEDPAGFVPRSYYYDAGVEPEERYQDRHKYTTQLPTDAKIYDLKDDPDKFVPQSLFPGGVSVDFNAVERKIKDAGYFGFRHSGLGDRMSHTVAVFHPLNPTKTEAPDQWRPPLGKAITAGGMGAAPSQLVGGAALQREELVKRKSEIMAAFRDWDRVSPIKKFLKMRLPDASEKYIDRFAALVGDYQVKKSEELFQNLQKSMKLASAIKLFEALDKNHAESPAPPAKYADGFYKVMKKDSPRQLARFAVHGDHFTPLEDHRQCFGEGCEEGPMGDAHHSALQSLTDAGHSIVPEQEGEEPTEQEEIYQITIPESGDIIVVKLVNNQLTTMDGTVLPERNVDSILEAVAAGELQMEPIDSAEGFGQEAPEGEEGPGVDEEAPALDSEEPPSELPDALKGGKADGMSPEDFDPEQLAAGVKVEMEHTNDPKVAEKIAMDHLSEDTEYYEKLASIHQD